MAAQVLHYAMGSKFQIVSFTIKLQPVKDLSTLGQTAISCTRLYHAYQNKAGYTATLVACGWAGAVMEVTGAFRQEQ